MSDHAYILFYKGVQLGDECFRVAPVVEVNPVQVTRLFRSPIAAVHRTTTGRVYRHDFAVHVIQSPHHTIAERIEQWDELADDQPGTVEVYQGVESPVLIKTIEDAYLETPQPSVGNEPGAPVAQVRLVFTTNRRST